MATHGWRTGRTLKEQLFEEGSSFNYFQLIHLLERTNAQHQQESEDSSHANNKEPKLLEWKMSADLDSAFAVSEIRDIQVRQEKTSRDIEGDETEDNQSQQAKFSLVAKTANYCIGGHLGPLPENYTDWIREQQREGRHAMADFLDIFNHRINLLRYEAKQSSAIALDHHQPEDSLVAPGISAVMGMLGIDLFEQIPLSKRSIMSISGLLATRRVSAHVIQRLLKKCFKIETKVTDVQAIWRDTVADQHWRLGQSGVSNLGELCLLGQKNLDMQGKIRIDIGPVPIQIYLALMPDFEFSRDQIDLCVRTDKDLLLTEYDGRLLQYPLANAGENSRFKSVQVKNSPVKRAQADNNRLENIRLSYDSERPREQVMVPTTLWEINSKLRACQFSGYLHRPLVALLRYLTNSKVDIEVHVQVDPETINLAYQALVTPDAPQDAHLRLGQSFWLGTPDLSAQATSCFTLNGFDQQPVDKSIESSVAA